MDKTPEQEAFDFTIANPEKSTSECYIAGRSKGLEREKELEAEIEKWKDEYGAMESIISDYQVWDTKKSNEIQKLIGLLETQIKERAYNDMVIKNKHNTADAIHECIEGAWYDFKIENNF